MIRIVKTSDGRVKKFNARPAFPEEAEKAAAEVLSDIKAHGERPCSNTSASLKDIAARI